MTNQNSIRLKKSQLKQFCGINYGNSFSSLFSSLYRSSWGFVQYSLGFYSKLHSSGVKNFKACSLHLYTSPWDLSSKPCRSLWGSFPRPFHIHLKNDFEWLLPSGNGFKMTLFFVRKRSPMADSPSLFGLCMPQISPSTPSADPTPTAAWSWIEALMIGVSMSNRSLKRSMNILATTKSVAFSARWNPRQRGLLNIHLGWIVCNPNTMYFLPEARVPASVCPCANALPWLATTR